MTSKTTTLFIRLSAVLWIIWGFVHALGGVLTISLDTASAVSGIADAVDSATLSMVYPDAVGAIVNQHGFNLLWFGLATIVGAVFIWRKSATAIWVTALIGGLADVGYFIFLDLGGFVNFLPGGFMTVVSSAAIILSLVAYYGGIKR